MMLNLYGVEVVELDTLIDAVECDLTRDEVYDDLLRRIEAGEFFAAIIGTPCSTFSVARIPRPDRPADDGPAQVRCDKYPEGRPGLADWLQRQVDVSNLLVERTVGLARALRAVKASVIVENPVTRSDPYTDHYRWVWRSHASLWMHEKMRGLLAEAWMRTVTFPQCALDGDYQKFTTLAYSSDLYDFLSTLGELRCTHDSHKKQAVGRDPETGKWRSAEAAAYPAAMNARLVHAVVAAWRRRQRGVHVGSAKPHAATAQEAAAARPATRPLPTTSSIRRLEPEVEEVLRGEAMPAANASPSTAWAEAPSEPRAPPAPLPTARLMSADMRQRLRAFRTAIAACFDAARRGRWKWARDHRPPPLHATEEECLLPEARGWVWAYNLEDHMWHPVTPSSWPADPPPGELEVAVIVQYATEHGFSDMEVISFIAHGYPGPDLERCAVLGPPHVGALKEMAAFDKAAAKDRKQGWARGGYLLPPVWPMRADPMNIVMRKGKGRMTIDKTIMLVLGVTPYNDGVDLDAQPSIDYVTVSMLGRASAILLTAGVRVRVWGFDLEAYFRKTGKQRRDMWMSGFVHDDGYGVDERVQFGQREAPVLTGRQSCFIVWAIRRELLRLDKLYPTAVAGVALWLAERRAGLEAGGAATDSYEEYQLAVLFFVIMFVDDVGGVSIDDDLVDQAGLPIFVVRDGATVQQSRAWMHYEAAIGVIREFGHTDADGKGVTPNLDMVYLGVTIDIAKGVLALSLDKATEYGELVDRIIDGQPWATGVRVSGKDLESLTHKLLHAATVVPLGRQHLFHLMRAARSETRLAGGAKVVGGRALVELRWWREMLRREACQRGLPLAYRRVFPDASAEGVLTPYSDASRELTSMSESGWGAWCVISGTLFYVEGRWREEEVLRLDINSLELAAMDLGSFTFLAKAAELGVVVTHLYEFTDNTAAEHSAERGKPKSARLEWLVRRRYEALAALGVAATAARVASVDNDIADGLSRGGEQLSDALRIAASAGMPVERLQPEARWRDLSDLLQLAA